MLCGSFVEVSYSLTDSESALVLASLRSISFTLESEKASPRMSAFET